MGRVKDFDYGYKGLVNRVYGLEKPTITVGIFEADGAELYDDVTTVIQVAIWNEFGTENIPERSFIRAWFDENQEKARRGMAKLMQAVIAGKYTKEQALELIAQRFVGEIQRRIAQGIDPANAASTIKRKGSSKPLIDTGQLRSALTYAIDDGKPATSKLGKKREKRIAKAKKGKARADAKARAALKRKGIKILKTFRKSAKSTVKKVSKVFRPKRRRAAKS